MIEEANWRESSKMKTKLEHSEKTRQHIIVGGCFFVEVGTEQYNSTL